MTARNPGLAMLLAELRAELLVAPSEEMLEEHVCMMRLEQNLLAPDAPANARPWSARPPRTPITVRVRRAAYARPRRAAALVAAICVLSASFGLNAAGALPDALRHVTNHITNSIVHTFGVPQAPHQKADAAPGSTRAPNTSAGALASPLVDQPGVAGSGATGSSAPTPTASASSPPSTGPHPASRHQPTGGTTPSGPSGWSGPTGGSGGSGGSGGTGKPPKINMGQDPNTPPGFPSDWRTRAIEAARAQLTTCAQVNALDPTGCPQQAAAGTGLTPGTVRWAILNQPLAAATAIAVMPSAGTRADRSAGTQVSVYGLFQMDAAYTVSGDATHPRFAYSGGIAAATMTWDGSTFRTVTFAKGIVAGQLPSTVHLPLFARPDSIANSAVSAAAESAFTACAITVPVANPSIANCPQSAVADPSATSAQWSLDGDPLQGALVSFDTYHGDFTVTGTYTMTLTSLLPSGATSQVTVTSAYTATLVVDGPNLQLLAISNL